MTSASTHPLNRRMLVKFSLKLAAAGLLAAVAVLFGAAAYGSDTPAVRGQACTKVGEHRKNRAGTEYVCEQRTDDRCPVWHAAHPAKGPWPKPSPCLCPSKSPKPSPSSSHPKPASPTPSGSTSTSAVASSPVPSIPATPVADQLPVTGTADVVWLAGVAFLALGAGGLFIFLPRIVRRRTPEGDLP